MNKTLKKIFLIGGISIASAYFITVGVRAFQIRKNNNTVPLNQEQQVVLSQKLTEN